MGPHPNGSPDPDPLSLVYFQILCRGDRKSTFYFIFSKRLLVSYLCSTNSAYPFKINNIKLTFSFERPAQGIIWELGSGADTSIELRQWSSQRHWALSQCSESPCVGNLFFFFTCFHHLGLPAQMKKQKTRGLTWFQLNIWKDGAQHSLGLSCK